jgi:hypothetical protein
MEGIPGAGTGWSDSSAAPVVLRRNLLVDAQMLFDFGYAREKVVNFFCKPRITCALLLQPLDAAVNHRNLGSHVAQAIMNCSELFVGVFELVNHFRSETVNARVQLGNVLFGRHVRDDTRQHLPDFVERRFFCCHM